MPLWYGSKSANNRLFSKNPLTALEETTLILNLYDCFGKGCSDCAYRIHFPEKVCYCDDIAKFEITNYSWFYSSRWLSIAFKKESDSVLFKLLSV